MVRKRTTNEDLLDYCKTINELMNGQVYVEFLNRMGKYEIEVNGVTYQTDLSKANCGLILQSMRYMTEVIQELYVIDTKEGEKRYEEATNYVKEGFHRQVKEESNE